MFDFGLSEFFLILAVAIIIIKPHQYPKIFRTIGQAYGYCYRLYHRILNEITDFTETFEQDTPNQNTGENRPTDETEPPKPFPRNPKGLS